MLLVSSLPGIAGAAEPAVSLQEAIQTVKQKLTVPPGYSEFSSQFNSYDKRQTWSLSWRPAGGGENGLFNVSVDAGTGEIIGLDTWKSEPEQQSRFKMPKVSKEDAAKIAGKFLQNIIPNRLSSMSLVPRDNQIIPLSGYGNSSYSLYWERRVQGIPVNGDGANVSVSMTDGTIINYSLNWTNKEMPSAAGVISPQEASQAFEKNGLLQLQYMLSREDRKKEPKPILVYRVYHSSNGIIDATTGAPVEMDNEMWIGGGGDGGMKYAKSEATQDSVAGVPLTPEESQEVDSTAKLLSQEEAISIVKKWISIPAGLDLNNASLEKDWSNPDRRIWGLGWQTARKVSGPSYVWARVDARTGEMISFNLDYGDEKTGSTLLSRDEARKLAEAYIKQHEERFSQVKADPLNGDYKQGSSDRYWRFSYLRSENDLLCPGNGIEVGVDAVHKCVNSYNMNWTAQKFPAAEGILTLAQANEKYLQKSPLQLGYAPIYSQDGIREYKLVYTPVNSEGNDSKIIDAVSGESLDGNGQPLKLQSRPYTFSDIAGYFGQREISLLGQAGIMGEYGDVFHPQENVRLVSLMRAMIAIKDSVWRVQNMTDQEVMDSARSRGWLKENLDPAAGIDKGLLARYVLRFLDIEYLAGLQGVYQASFSDLPPGHELYGYAALLKGLGIMNGSGANFDAGHSISRGEAAVVLVRTIESQNQAQDTSPVPVATVITSVRK
jgi:hypothetical protein